MRLALAAVAALALAAAGCGGVESEPNLAEAAEKTEARGSFAFEMTWRTSDGEASTGTCDGVVDSVRELARQTCADDVIGAIEAVMVGDTSYQRDRGDQKWTKARVPGEFPLSEFSPSLMLERLRSANAKTERIGEEDVRGEPAVRYELTVDCEKAQLYLECEGETVGIDVWIDDDGLVRRIRFDGAKAAAGFDIEFFGFGGPVEVEAPPADQVIETADLLPPLSLDPCKAEDADPVRVEQAIDAFRQSGFEVLRSPDECGPGIAAEFGTHVPRSIEGLLWCQVLADGTGLSTSGSVVGSVVRSHENLVCNLDPDHADAPDDAVERLDAAFAELKRELGP